VYPFFFASSKEGVGRGEGVTVSPGAGLPLGWLVKAIVSQKSQTPEGPGRTWDISVCVEETGEGVRPSHRAVGLGMNLGPPAH
jgi:hypothetical protein